MRSQILAESQALVSRFESLAIATSIKTETLTELVHREGKVFVPD